LFRIVFLNFLVRDDPLLILGLVFHVDIVIDRFLLLTFPLFTPVLFLKRALLVSLRILQPNHRFHMISCVSSIHLFFNFNRLLVPVS
jgi:hypothetical protein